MMYVYKCVLLVQMLIKDQLLIITVASHPSVIPVHQHGAGEGAKPDNHIGLHPWCILCTAPF